MSTPTTVIGYASLANRSYTVRDQYGTFIETVASGAFGGGVLTRCDCRYLINHDGIPLARNTAGTLALTADALGLFYEADLDTRMIAAADLVHAIERGDVSQNSFGFTVAEDKWDADYTRRTILRVEDLLDVSAVTYPASPTTWLKLKTTDSEARRAVMIRTALELDLLHHKSPRSARGLHNLTGKDMHLTPQKRSAADSLAARLTDEELVTMRKAGQKRRAKLDDGAKTYRSVFGAGERGSERR